MMQWCMVVRQGSDGAGGSGCQGGVKEGKGGGGLG